MQGSFLVSSGSRQGFGPQVKVCGFTRASDIEAACRLGIDAAGFVLFRRSRRCVSAPDLDRLVTRLSSEVTPVFLFVDPEREEVLRALERFPEAMLQFHGKEPPEFCSSFGVPYLKAIYFKNSGDLSRAAPLYRDAAGLLADCPAPDGAVPGGNGVAFDWGRASREAASCPLPVVVAGGLDPGNAREAVRLMSPAALDVSSGVEESPGIKSPDKISRFLAAARRD